MKIELFPPLAIHEKGKRDNQEDALWPKDASSENCLFLLCDGMGGHENGEVASRVVSISISDFLCHISNPNENPFNDDNLKRAIEYAYHHLDLEAGDESSRMGTTLTLLCLHQQGMTAAHMGDSRIYHIRPGVGILYQSRDHSLVFDLFQAGEITYDEMDTYPQKNVVTRAMMPGEENRMRPDIVHITDILPNDYFYMCTDGMLEQMDNKELFSLLSSESSDEEKRQQLIKSTANNHDNHSAWLIHIKDVVKKDGEEQLVNEEPTSRCNAINIIPQEYAAVDDVVVVKDSPKMKSYFLRLQNLFRNHEKKK